MGLAVGWKLLRNGIEQVEIFEAGEAGRSGAAWVAGGMLCPRAEAGFEDMDVYEEGVESLNLYPLLLNELREDAGDVAPAIDNCGTMMLATNADEVRELHRQFEFRKREGVPVELITGEEAREREPLLSAKVKSAMWLAKDAQINNRKLVLALRQAFRNRGGTLHEQEPVSEIVIRNGRAVAVLCGDVEHEASSITVAAGAWSSKVGGLWPNLSIRPVKGQVIGLRIQPFAKLKQPIRTPRVYIVPKDDGRLLVGATSEEVGYDKRVTAGPVMELLHYAWDVFPAVFELEIEELMASFRPATKDHRPIVGDSETNGLYYATGHYRHGILMMPLAAKKVTEAILKHRHTQTHFVSTAGAVL